MTQENTDDSMVIYCYIRVADIDVDNLGHIIIEKHRRSTMEKTIKELRKHIGKSVAIYISPYTNGAKKE